MNPSKVVVLIVDDTPADIKILAELLYPAYATLFAKDGETALLMAKERRPNLILLDILMPGLDGYEVHRRLKADPATADIPVIFVTALDQEENEIAGLELGAVDYISKPFNPAVVRARVRNHLAMHEALRMREDVDRMIRHDIKHPIGAILGFADMLLEEKETPAKIAEGLTAIRCASLRALAILNKSLDIYALESELYLTRPVPVDGISMLRKTIREVQGRKSDEISFDLLVNGRAPEPGEQFLLLAEELMLYSLFTNLLVNAMEASPSGAVVTVRVDNSDQNEAMISIRNKGAVPAAIRARFFEKYVTAGKPGGMGLGAYTARLMARAMDGDMSVLVSDEDNETLIRVSLPMAKQAASAPGQTDAQTDAPLRPADLPPLSILLIDDSEMTHFFVRAYLKGSPCSLDTALTGEQGLALCQRGKYDLLLLDHYLPDHRGDEVLRRLREWESVSGKKHMPVVSITGLDENEATATNVTPGFSCYLHKPLERNVFFRAILQHGAASSS